MSEGLELASITGSREFGGLGTSLALVNLTVGNQESMKMCQGGRRPGRGSGGGRTWGGQRRRWSGASWQGEQMRKKLKKKTNLDYFQIRLYKGGESFMSAEVAAISGEFEVRYQVILIVSL